jgi:hypothetical protein
VSEIVTPQQVERRLLDLGSQMDEAHKMLIEAEANDAAAQAAWRVNSAKARMEIRAKAATEGRKMTVTEIDDEALLMCEKEVTAQITCESLLRAARSNVSRVKTQVDIARSIGTSVRVSMDLA